MSSPRITSDERRGLIVLIIILIIATILLCWRDRPLQHRADDTPADTAVPVSVMADSLLISAPPLSTPHDTVEVSKKRKNKRDGHTRKATTRPNGPAHPNTTSNPATRNPRDERVD